MIPSSIAGPRTRVVISITVVFIGLMFFALALHSLGGAGATGSSGGDLRFTRTWTDDPRGSIDPGYAKDVAKCVSWIKRNDKVRVDIYNGYPSYTCTFTVEVFNGGYVPVKLTAVQFSVPWDVLTVTPLDPTYGTIIHPGKKERERFSVHIEQPAIQGYTYSFEVYKVFREAQTGTIGFWKNWSSHKKFSQAQIESWLRQIDDSSSWFGPRTTSGMEALFADGLGPGATPYSRFRAHCLATRLNERSGILPGSDTHNVTGVDPGNYLGLATPANATLNQIIAAIEAKFGTSPTNSQYNVMKDVCDRLNNLLI